MFDENLENESFINYNRNERRLTGNPRCCSTADGIFRWYGCFIFSLVRRSVFCNGGHIIPTTGFALVSSECHIYNGTIFFMQHFTHDSIVLFWQKGEVEEKVAEALLDEPFNLEMSLFQMLTWNTYQIQKLVLLEQRFYYKTLLSSY